MSHFTQTDTQFGAVIADYAANQLRSKCIHCAKVTTQSLGANNPFTTANPSHESSCPLYTPPALEATGEWVDVTPGDVVIANDGIPDLDNFGTSGMTVDPSRDGAAFFGGDHQGIWETTDAGLTWTKVYTAGHSSGFNGSPWSQAWAPSGAFGVANNGYGSSGGVWRTTDRGRNWTQVVSADINDVSMSPTDEDHLMATSHSNDTYYESTDGGLNWTPITVPAGQWYYGEFFSDSIWVGIGPNGLWTAQKSGGSWSWNNPLAIDGPHGGAQYHRLGGYLYLGGMDGNGRKKIYRTSDGLNFTEVADLGSGYANATVFGSSSLVIAQANFAQHLPYDPNTYSTSNGTDWVAGPEISTVNGAHSAALVVNPAGQEVILTANTNGGIWRRVMG